MKIQLLPKILSFVPVCYMYVVPKKRRRRSNRGNGLWFIAFTGNYCLVPMLALLCPMIRIHYVEWIFVSKSWPFYRSLMTIPGIITMVFVKEYCYQNVRYRINYQKKASALNFKIVYIRKWVMPRTPSESEFIYYWNAKFHWKLAYVEFSFPQIHQFI